MSHFVIAVALTESEYDGGDCEYAIEEKIKLFDENMEVAPYKTECWCVNREAINESEKQAQRELGWDWKAVRERFWEENSGKSEDETDRIWGEIIKPYCDRRDKLASEHPMHNKPKDGCENCQGTGEYLTTYNPESKWDWWVIGGRWDGIFEEYDRLPDKNAAYGEELVTHTVCWGLVVPDHNGVSRWAEKGKMGWFGMSSNNNENWDAIRSELFTKYKEFIFVAIDCHI